MASFYIWETVDFPIQLTSEDENSDILKDFKDVIVSLNQNNILLEKNSTSKDIIIDSENDIINLHLSQDDTGLFDPGKVIVQINILYSDGERDTTVQTSIKALSNLHKEVMT